MPRENFEIVTDYEVVTEYVPRPPKQYELSEKSKALMAGNTIFVPGMSKNSVGSRFRAVHARGFTVRSQAGERDGVAGRYIWAEPKLRG